MCCGLFRDDTYSDIDGDGEKYDDEDDDVNAQLGANIQWNIRNVFPRNTGMFFHLSRCMISLLDEAVRGLLV